MATIHLANLPRAARQELIEHKLPEAQVIMIYDAYQRKYHLQQKGMKRAASVLLGAIGLNFFLLLYGTADAPLPAGLWLTLIGMFVIIFVGTMGFAYWQTTVVPRQFCKALAQGYPSLRREYTYERMTHERPRDEARRR